MSFLLPLCMLWLQGFNPVRKKMTPFAVVEEFVLAGVQGTSINFCKVLPQSVYGSNCPAENKMNRCVYRGAAVC